MDKKTLQTIVTHEAGAVWDELCTIHPALEAYPVPKIVLNGRLYRTAGRCFQDSRIVHLATQFLLHTKESQAYMIDQILPHELAHQADFDLWGNSEKSCGHGSNWKMLMLQLGLRPLKNHPLWINK